MKGSSYISRRQLLKATAAVVAGASLTHGVTIFDPRARPDVAEAAIDAISNGNIQVTIDQTTGAIIQITNLAVTPQIPLIAVAPTSPAWKIQLQPNEPEDSNWITATGSSFTYVKTGTMRFDLTWVQGPYTVTATIMTPTGSMNAQITCQVQNSSTNPVSLLEYPVVSGIQNLLNGSGTNVDYLAHSFATGYLFTNPYTLFNLSSVGQTGIQHSPSMEGYNGTPMQWFAYYTTGSAGNGGFYFATQDGNHYQKSLDFFKDSAASMTARFRHGCPAINATTGNGYTVSYPITIGALTDGTWYQAADTYRVWALTQGWTQQGPLVTRSNKATWLLEKVGFCTFAINSEYDRSAFLTYLHGIANTSVFHILGVNWQQIGADYFGSTQSGGRDATLPHRFFADNLNAIKATKSDGTRDYVTAMSFDTLYRTTDDGVDSIEGKAVQQVFPPQYVWSRETYTTFSVMCPVPSLETDLYTFRATYAVMQAGLDASYDDIGIHNNLKVCLATNHGHPVGAGPQLMSASRAAVAQTKATATRANGGAYFPMGAEVVLEDTIPEMDFYQARGEASPVTTYESYDWWTWMQTSPMGCQKIPAFAYVYHDYGPTRLDGWGRLSVEQGDLFYWCAARVYLWGGLFELNYEFGSVESVNGTQDDPSQSFSPTTIERPYAVDPAKITFLNKMATARTGFANPYLAYGQMARPVVPNSPPPNVTLSWLSIGADPATEEYLNSGSLSVPSVVASAYLYNGVKAAFLYVNLQTTPQNIQVTLNPATYGLPTSGLNVYQTTVSGTSSLGAISGSTTYTISLPAREILMLEMR